MTAEKTEHTENIYYRNELPYLRLKKTRKVDTFVIDEIELEARGETMNETLEAIYKLSKLSIQARLKAARGKDEM